MEKDLKRGVIVDYSEEARAQYWNLYLSVGKLLIRLGYLNILEFAESEERPSQLPSWVPNWNSRAPSSGFGKHYDAGCYQQSVSLDGALFLRSNSLRVRGFRIGTIKETSALQWTIFKKLKELEGSDGIAAQLLTRIDQAFAAYQRVCQEPDRLMLERFARTLVANNGSSLISQLHQNHAQDALEDYEWFRKYLLHWKHAPNGPPIDNHHLFNNIARYIANLPSIWRHRSFFVTESGHIGLCSQSCRPGDIVCIFLSLRHTYVVRKVPEKRSVKLISCAYTDGVMYREAFDGRDTALDETFIIA
jgi:hypothetical protein